MSESRMSKRLSFTTLTRLLKTTLEELSEHRKGKNLTYALHDAVLGAFSVFFMQSALFLASQDVMDSCEGRNNATILSGRRNAYLSNCLLLKVKDSYWRFKGKIIKIDM